MAHDLRSIPISTVAFVTFFSVSGWMYDQFCSSILFGIAEALICTRDWLFGKSVYPHDLDSTEP